jgi:outer membrane protein insertion porin family
VSNQRAVLLLVTVISALFLIQPLLSRAEDIRVTLVEVQGNRRIESATILAKVKTREGALFSPAQVKEDIRTLFQLGHFEDVQVRTEGFERGLKVIFWVKEKPLIREVSIEGNAEITTDILKELITLLPRTAFNLQLIQENAEKIRLKYQDKGYYHAIVVPVIVDLRTGDKNVVFYIEEGESIRLTQVNITGNEAIESDEIKESMKNQEWWFFSFLGNSGTLRSEALREDVEAIRNLYYNKGYIQVQVDDPVIEEHPYTEHTHEFLGQPETYVTRNEVSLKITIKEGDQFRVDSVTLRGNTSIPTEDLLKEVKLKRGDVFSREVMRQDVNRIIDRFDSIARPFANVTPSFKIDEQAKTVMIAIDIQEGGEVRIGRIDITGNSKTRDKVVRREMRLDEGDLYSRQALRRSYERINNLNFFETVELLPERRLQEPIMDLNVKVAEKMTGSLSIGGGYSSVDKLMAIAEVTQGNLGGRGQLLKFKTQWGATRKLYMISFMEPYIFDKPVWGRVDVYKQDTDYDGYKLDTNGFGLGVGKSYTEYVSASIRYGYDSSRIYDVTSSPSFALQNQLDIYGDMLNTSSLTLSLTRDSRDFYLDPKKGSRNTVSVQYAGGPLGGDPEFVKTTGDSAWYFPVFWDTVFMLRGRAGFANSLNDLPLPLGERFYVGGPSSVRGYRYGTVGPMDEFENRLGGNKEVIFNVEYKFPLVPAARLNGVLFYDVGRAFDESEPIRMHELRHAWGWGFWWLSPLGPLRFEWGYIINQKPEDRPSQFEFSIGTLF